MLMKIHFSSFHGFCFYKNLLVLPTNVFSHYNTFKIECNEGHFLDVNQKRTFLDIQKIPKATKLKKCVPKKKPE